MTESLKYIHDCIQLEVQKGFLPKEEIFVYLTEVVEDEELDEEVSEEWLNQQINKVFDAHQIESKNWVPPTDVEKLTQAFDNLCTQNIIALHEAGYTQSDAGVEVSMVEQEIRRHGIYSDGYCYYHGQDLERAIEDNVLLIG